jgi:hypothetical protein
VNVTVSILALVDAGAERLIPADVQAHVQACVDAPEDDAPMLAFADRLADYGEEKLEYAVRWLVKWKKRPGLEDDRVAGRYLFAAMGTGSDLSCRLPEYVIERQHIMILGTWLHCLAQVALRLDMLRDHLDVSAVQTAKAD